MVLIRVIGVLLAGVLVLGTTAPAQAAETDRYLTNTYQSDPADWNDPWRDSTVGPRNNLGDVDGHVGLGTRVTIPNGQHFGAAMRWRFADNGFTEPDQLWFRYFLRFPEGFSNIGKGKLPGPAGIYSASGRGNRRSTEEEPGWSARMLFAPPDAAQAATHTRIGYYVYHLDQAKDHGDLLLWDEQVATLQHGRWYCVEGHLAINDLGESNGALHGWVDGEPAFGLEELRFRRANEPTVLIDSFWFDVYFGGRTAASEPLAIDFDSLAFGPDRLGCDDSSERGFDGDFFDDEGSVHEPSIELLHAAGVVDGCNSNGDAFCPDDLITRGQLAKLLVRALDLAASETDYFSDDDGSPFEADINAIAALGVTNGCGDGMYCPHDAMSRAAVAAFVSRALLLPDADRDHFTDDDSSVHQRDVNALAEAGLTFGCGDGIFCPDRSVTRSQAASFVARALTLQAQRVNTVVEKSPVAVARVMLRTARPI